jgi:hypothetical protein
VAIQAARPIPPLEGHTEVDQDNAAQHSDPLAVARSWWPTALPVLIFLAVFAVNEASTDNVTSDSLRAVSVAVAMVHFHTISLDFVRHTMPDRVEPHFRSTVVFTRSFPGHCRYSAFLG